ncbi:maleylpyruvate isomerase N-terminal domain-containing protein [Brevibacterium sp. RIT 803]|uniref:maleylpyruvate isomerase N-terminal domain-containing protein n=1 Tax=Brevibacterium sp. RIT 803 TaxID=2810210 RepID=UPI001951EFBA|nr:maleylpyruvate isomerase N-terminal domain-containing protein [Brevibacterium sp. RIT 803]MBM6591967.1 maleylpyruvate isomerase N-terminal domain-containing protein [Brevibacterium sp. RIT 803]
MDDPLIDKYLDQAEVCWVTALKRVSKANLHSPSGCREWTNEQLINHLIGGGLRYQKLLAQAPPAEVEATRGQDHLGENLIASFWTHERAFRRIAGESDLDREVHHRIGLISGRQLVNMRILELALHAADLSIGTGDVWPIDDDLAEYISTHLGELIADLGSAGGYAAPRPEPDAGASHAQRVLNISGR